MNVAEQDNEIIAHAARCQYDPLSWAEFAWDWGLDDLSGSDGPREWQRDIHHAISDRLSNLDTRYQPVQIAVASGHGIGKSALMGQISNWAMSCWDDAKIVCTANTLNQLSTKTVPEISTWFRRSITGHWFDTQATSIKSVDPEHSDSWRMDFVPWSQNNTEAFAGLHNKGKIIVLLFDEASKIHDKVWEVAEGALTDEDTVILWLVFGNPTQNSGRFRECFRRYRHRWMTWQIDSRTVPGTNKEKIQQWLEDHGKDSDFFKVRVRGQFPSQSARQFISSDDADAARNRVLRPEQFNFAPKILTVDPAWSGDDELVIGLRQGLHFKVLQTMAKNDNDMAVAQRVAYLEDEHKADAVFVDAGYGTGIVSGGTTLGRSWRLVWFSGTSPDEGCLNLRAYMWREMRNWLKAGGAIDPHDAVLYDDIIGPETVPRMDGKIQLESKEDMKDRGLPSPNRGDSLALSFAAPVAKKWNDGVPVGRANSEYQMFS
ncbi:terminase [Solidesulfovibrio sp.]|uniref:terminase n=1 Tax=Solidesulfovibrio sp. TaxID=2910990 RepID=UPI002608A1A5|nr:terminase [Solidesulfovibrio sp.]